MDQSQCPCPSSAAVQTLRRQIARIETLRRRPDEPPVSSGCPPLDGILPEGGLHRGTLTEWLADGDGAGATTLAVLAAREACRQGGTLVVVDADGGFYPPAAVRLGIAPEQLLLVRADQRADHDWALDQALRCPAVAAVMAWPESPAGRLDDRTFRRLQLAAEAGGSLGLLVRGRPTCGRRPPGPTCGCWSSRSRPTRKKGTVPICRNGPKGAWHKWGLSPFSTRRLRIVLLRCRGGREGRSIELELDDESHPLFTAAPESRRPMPPAIPGLTPSLESLAAWCQRFSPLVGIERTVEPASLLLDITGLAHLFGGEAALAEQVLGDFAARGLRGPTGRRRHARRRLGGGAL